LVGEHFSRTNAGDREESDEHDLCRRKLILGMLLIFGKLLFGKLLIIFGKFKLLILLLAYFCLLTYLLILPYSPSEQSCCQTLVILTDLLTLPPSNLAARR